MSFDFDPPFDESVEKLLKELDATVGDEELAADLFTVRFMTEHTMFESLGAMIDASPLASTPLAEFEAASREPEWDAYVADHTRFSSWEEMKSAALAEQVAARRKT